LRSAAKTSAASYIEEAVSLVIWVRTMLIDLSQPMVHTIGRDGPGLAPTPDGVWEVAEASAGPSPRPLWMSSCHGGCHEHGCTPIPTIVVLPCANRASPAERGTLVAGNHRDHVQPERTSHHHDHDVVDLVARKRAQGLTIAVVIPARNEQATVGRVVSVLREQVMLAHPLIDDLLVVDGDSSDATAERARAAGARVISQSDVLPETGSRPGKGEALWKGLAATATDIVCFVDADIVDINGRFVVGLLGPLLKDPSILFTKACYDRPLVLGEEVHEHGGGRVTELLARPLIGAFWPELSWLVQPLSGEYAGRRTLLESLPFVQGYGVELAMLVDIANQYGAQAIAQVDLGNRRHEHQSLAALGRMSGELLAVAMDRLARQDKVVLSEQMVTTLLQPERRNGRFALAEHEIATGERPAHSHWCAPQPGRSAAHRQAGEII
jgi:glucosyl-3-phosphoglycerate synthase